MKMNKERERTRIGKRMRKRKRQTRQYIRIGILRNGGVEEEYPHGTLSPVYGGRHICMGFFDQHDGEFAVCCQENKGRLSRYPRYVGTLLQACSSRSDRMSLEFCPAVGHLQLDLQRREWSGGVPLSTEMTWKEIRYSERYRTRAPNYKHEC